MFFLENKKETQKSRFFWEKFVENMGERVEKLFLRGKHVETVPLCQVVIAEEKAKRRLWR